jgi:hypothetical protein
VRRFSGSGGTRWPGAFDKASEALMSGLFDPLLAGEPYVYIPDLAEIDHPFARAAVELTGSRAMLSVPSRTRKALLGIILAARRR